MLVGNREYRKVAARIVRACREPRDRPIEDVDVTLADELWPTREVVDADEHRRAACEARAEVWRAIRAGDVLNDESFEAMKVFEEMGHTE